MDVKLTFLNGDLEEQIYIQKLEGFTLTENEGFVCKLKMPYIDSNRLGSIPSTTRL